MLLDEDVVWRVLQRSICFCSFEIEEIFLFVLVLTDLEFRVQ